MTDEQKAGAGIAIAVAGGFALLGLVSYVQASKPKWILPEQKIIGDVEEQMQVPPPEQIRVITPVPQPRPPRPPPASGPAGFSIEFRGG